MLHSATNKKSVEDGNKIKFDRQYNLTCSMCISSESRNSSLLACPRLQ